MDNVLTLLKKYSTIIVLLIVTVFLTYLIKNKNDKIIKLDKENLKLNDKIEELEIELSEKLNEIQNCEAEKENLRTLIEELESQNNDLESEVASSRWYKWENNY